MSVISPRPLRIALGSATIALALLSGCTSSEETTTPSTAAASGSGSGSGSTPAGSAPGTTEDASTGTTAATTEAIDNDDILAALEADHPDLVTLVDPDVMSWNAFGGFIIPVPAGTEVATAIELCEAVSDVVYEGGEDAITIATDVTIDNLQGTPIVERPSEADTCTAV